MLQQKKSCSLFPSVPYLTPTDTFPLAQLPPAFFLPHLRHRPALSLVQPFACIAPAGGTKPTTNHQLQTPQCGTETSQPVTENMAGVDSGFTLCMMPALSPVGSTCDLP